MTRKEMEEAKKIAREENPYTPEGFSFSNTQIELQCRDMINSCLCYGSDFSRYEDDYIEKLGEERVRELYKEQEEDFAEAKVLENTFIDDEGLSYNRIVWADEM